MDQLGCVFELNQSRRPRVDRAWDMPASVVLRPSSSTPTRSPICGLIAQYNATTPMRGPDFFVLRKPLLRVKQLGASRRMPMFVGW